MCPSISWWVQSMAGCFCHMEKMCLFPTQRARVHAPDEDEREELMPWWEPLEVWCWCWKAWEMTRHWLGLWVSSGRTLAATNWSISSPTCLLPNLSSWLILNPADTRDRQTTHHCPFGSLWYTFCCPVTPVRINNSSLPNREKKKVKTLGV